MSKIAESLGLASPFTHTSNLSAFLSAKSNRAALLLLPILVAFCQAHLAPLPIKPVALVIPDLKPLKTPLAILNGTLAISPTTLPKLRKYQGMSSVSLVVPLTTVGIPLRRIVTISATFSSIVLVPVAILVSLTTLPPNDFSLLIPSLPYLRRVSTTPSPPMRLISS